MYELVNFQGIEYKRIIVLQKKGICCLCLYIGFFLSSLSLCIISIFIGILWFQLISLTSLVMFFLVFGLLVQFIESGRISHLRLNKVSHKITPIYNLKLL